MKVKEPGIVVGVSNRHVHLSQEDLEVLFGEGYELHPIKGSIEKVRVLGPVRKETQIEISQTDAFKLGVKAPVRDSGDLDGTPGIKIVGPKGEVETKKGLILAKRHIHMLPEDAETYGVKDKDLVYVVVESGDRKLIFGDVLVRVSPKYALEFHVDTDEANAALIKTGDIVKIVEL
jgi:putative phosphotransacetylase